MPERASRLDVSVVAPVFRNRATLAELRDRIASTLDPLGCMWELILVDDCCPDGSAAEIERLAEADPRIVPIHLAERGGQQRALVAGIRDSRGERVVTLDADLQDPPEAIPVLLDRIGAASAVFAGRRGSYQSSGRLRSSRLFKRAISAVSGTPSDGGAFVALDRRTADAIGRFRTTHPFLPAMVGLLGVAMESVPVERDVREHGSSAYTGALRLRTGASALAAAAWWRISGRGPAALR